MIKFFLTSILLLEPLAKPLVVGFFQLPPHSKYKTTIEHSGIAQDFFGEIAKEMNISNFEYKELPLPRFIAELTEARVDIGLFLAKNAEREKNMIYSKNPFLIMKPSIAVLKNRFTKDTLSKSDLKDLNICVWQEGYKSELIKSSDVKIFELSGADITPRCLEMVKLKRVDGFYTPDVLSLRFELKKLGAEGQFEIKKIDDTDVGLYTVFSKKLDPKIIKKYELALKSLLSKTSYSSFYLKKLNITN